MRRLVLGPILRRVDHGPDGCAATIWIEADGPAMVSVLTATAPTFCVAGHHYALVVVDRLSPGATHEYDVRLDGVRVWPETGSQHPASVIRTHRTGESTRVLIGSCRAAAPHEPPYTLERMFDDEGRGIDTVWAHARRVAELPQDHWPDLLLFVGDQIYADDSSPGAKQRIADLRGDGSELPPEIIVTFEEYTWLYQESWSLPTERWLLSTVPSAMMFDDHDMIDDWNISASWVAEMHAEPWWREHHISGLMSYWIYQHLGNLSPSEIAEQGLLARLCAVDDATAELRRWVTALHDGSEAYRFSHVRLVGDTTVVAIDGRNTRELDGDQRRMVSTDEWAWVCRQARSTRHHLVLATPLPVFIADGLHDFQVWSERVCGGAWGRRAARRGEQLRRSLDLEDWSAFETSYREFVELIGELAGAEQPPTSVVVASGDIHYSYAARVPIRGSVPIWQVVCSPIRNALIPPERGVMRFTLTRTGKRLGAALRRLVGAEDSRPHIELAVGPLFANNLGVLEYEGDRAALTIEHYVPEGGQPELAASERLRLV